MARAGGKDRGITQRKGRDGWWVRIFHNGRERWHKCDTKSQAKALYGRLKADAREGRYFPEKFAQQKDITLRSWIMRCSEGSSNRSLVNEKRYGRRWSLLLGKRLLSEITTEDLRRLQTKFRSRMHPTHKDRHQWTNATINRHFAFLRHLFMLAVKDGKVQRNPVSGVKFLAEVKRTRFFNQSELDGIRNHLAEPHWHMVAFAVETGLRREEQFQLRWDQVDLETGVVTIPLPKGGKTRHVPLSDQALAILRCFDSFLQSPWVFPSPKDPLQHWNPQSLVNHVFMPALVKTGIKDGCWHTLRHTAASRRIMAGVDLVSVKEILGHRDIQTTLRYAHLAPGHLRDAVNRGSLSQTVTRTVTTEKQEGTIQSEGIMQEAEKIEKKGWLGDKDSNLGSQIQSLTSYH